MGNSLTWIEYCSTFQIYLNLNLRAKLREWKLNCQKNSVNPKGAQMAKYSTSLKDVSSPLIWALWLAPLHSKMNPRLNLNTMNFVRLGECTRAKYHHIDLGGFSSKILHLNAEGFGQERSEEGWSGSLFLCQIETFSPQQGFKALNHAHRYLNTLFIPTWTCCNWVIQSNPPNFTIWHISDSL